MMVAVVAEAKQVLYHEVLARLAQVERQYGRRAAVHDLLLAHMAEQERREAQAEMAKPGGKK
jgi:hypothetical protein